MPLCVKGFVFGCFWARCSGAGGGQRFWVLGCGAGPGSDLSKEPVFQDVEPVTLETESFLGVLPGPTRFQFVARCWASATRRL
jgi:hypothetical protein